MTKQYALYVKQEGEGCDYTIGCAQMLKKLNAQTIEETVDEITDIVENYALGKEEREVKEMFLVEIIHSLNVEDYMLPEEDEEDAATLRRREQYERLKKEFG